MVNFVQITHHGTYIDGFAGPQEDEAPESWTANLVLNVEQLRHFHFFELDPTKIERLRGLQDSQPYQRAGRTITIWPGDFNTRVLELLASATISEREATFCLLDQRTFECRWTTVQALARYQNGRRYKIELFYFLAQKWMPRALAEQEDPGPPEAWWGPDWRELRRLTPRTRADRFVERFRRELGYAYVMPWPILERDNTGSPVMYHMIHASDHPEAPALMDRAYRAAVLPTGEQLTWGWLSGYWHHLRSTE